MSRINDQSWELYEQWIDGNRKTVISTLLEQPVSIAVLLAAELAVLVASVDEEKPFLGALRNALLAASGGAGLV